MAEYIEQETVLEKIENCAMWARSFGELYEAVQDMQPADVAPVRHGRWLYVDTDTEQFFLCNRCKKKEYWESNYCPNCGCKMDLEG